MTNWENKAAGQTFTSIDRSSIGPRRVIGQIGWARGRSVLLSPAA